MNFLYLGIRSIEEKHLQKKGPAFTAPSAVVLEKKEKEKGEEGEKEEIDALNEMISCLPAGPLIDIVVLSTNLHDDEPNGRILYSRSPSSSSSTGVPFSCNL